MKNTSLNGATIGWCSGGTQVPRLGAAPYHTQGPASVSAVVTAANAFLATLSSSQKSAVVLTRTQALAVSWSRSRSSQIFESQVLFLS